MCIQKGNSTLKTIWRIIQNPDISKTEKAFSIVLEIAYILFGIACILFGFFILFAVLFAATDEGRKLTLESIVSFLLAISLMIAHFAYKTQKRNRGLQYIQTVPLPNNLWIEFQKNFPELTREDYNQAEQALRDFFKIRLCAPKKPLLGMPSKIVDELWHAFILDTRAYQDFCNTAFGSFFHHIPASSMHPDMPQEEGLQIVWEHACRLHDLDPERPASMPPLFSIDQRLIPNHGNVFYPSKTALDEAIQNGKPVGGYACPSGLAARYKKAKEARNNEGGGGCGGGCGGG